MSQLVNVLIIRSLGAESNRRIAEVSDRVKMVDVTRFMPESGSLKVMRPLWEVVAASGKTADIEASARIRQQFAEAEVMFGITVTLDLASCAPRLKWIQLVTAGVDYLPHTGLLSSEVTLTTARGVSDVPIAEYVIGAMLGHARGTLRCLDNKSARRWARFVGSELQGGTLGIIGLGSIGSEIARRIRSLGVNVVASDPYVSGDRARSVQATLMPLEQLLATSDYMVVTLPLTPETTKLIAGREFEMMKPSAFFVNVSRGAVIDESALVQALRSGRIAGAALDVYETEPLPRESPLWDIPNLYLSPHIAGSSGRHPERVTDLFCENLRRYVAGEPLVNVLDKKRGY